MPTVEQLEAPTYRTSSLCTDILVATDIPEDDLPNWEGWQEEGRALLGDTMVDRRGPAPTRAGRHFLLIGRANPPYCHTDGFVCTPGGFVDYGEDPKDCAPRELKEETGLERDFMTLIDVYGATDRDPRRHVVSLAYCCRVTPAEARKARGDDDAFWTAWIHEEDIRSGKIIFGFDHGDIVRDGMAILAMMTV